jgi:hypothetical protein
MCLGLLGGHFGAIMAILTLPPRTQDLPTLFFIVGNDVYTSLKLLFVSSVRGSPRVEMIPDDCSMILVSLVLISTKNADKSGAVQGPSNKGGPEAADGTAVDEFGFA